MRNIPDDNLAYPVLITLDTGSSGSSFLLKTDKKIFLITAKHVLFDEQNQLRGKKAELICQTKDIEDESVINYKIDLDKVIILKHENADVAAIELGLIKELEEPGSHYVQHHDGITVIPSAPNNSGTVSVSAKDSTKLLKNVLISNDVFLYGYPTSLGLKNTPQFDYSKPLLRKGIVANIYKTKGTIILDCPVYYGNSGGPVVEVSQNGLQFEHKIIGVVSQFIPFVEEWLNTKNGLVNTEFLNSGYSVAVAMDKVFEMINFKKE